MRPRIGITTSFEHGGQPPRDRVYLNAAYSDAIYAAGGLPLPIPAARAADAALFDDVLAQCDGLLFTGGPDLDPSRYGQARHPRTEVLHPRRDAFDVGLFAAADARGTPLLSICLGCQIAAVARGGCLVQHVDDVPRRGAVEHHRPDQSAAFHDVRIEPGSRLAQIVGATRVEVNSRHHQIVQREQVGERLRAVAFAPDDVVEAIEDTSGRFLVAVQWHPEDMTDRPEHLRLFEALVAAARGR